MARITGSLRYFFKNRFRWLHFRPSAYYVVTSRIVSTTAIFLVAANVEAHAAAVMTTPGAASVSSAGQFGYSIPIVVPPGTAGVVPDLSLGYSSSNTDGPEGLGWVLNGLTAIARCPRTMSLDTIHGSVNYDMNDRFCLNGLRLMATAASYGLDGTIYKPYIDDFSKIISHGTAGSGPAWFEIHLKSGTVLELGNTPDSQIQAVGKTTVREWLVDKITDTKGNYLTITYVNDQTNGQAYPSRIDYTGNSGAGLATYNSVRFTYTTRVDVTPTYQAGSLQQWTVLLTDIKTYAGSSVVTDYQFAYRAGTSTLHSRITSLTQCDGSGACLAPTTIGWQGGAGLPTMTGTAMSLAQGKTLSAGDFNGDGLTDALVFQTCPTGGAIYSGSNSGTFAAAGMTATYQYYNNTHHKTSYGGSACFSWVPYPTPSTETFLPGDFDGDGFTDLLFDESYWDASGIPAVFRPYSSPLMNNKTGALTQTNINVQYPTGLPQFNVLGDFNGDGLLDGYYQPPAPPNTSYSSGFYLSTGGGNFTQHTGPGTITNGDTLIAGDFDGDGCSDVLTQGTDLKINYFCNPAVANAVIPNFSGSQIVTGDFNGDGKTDLLIVGPSAATLYLSTGTGLSSAYTVSSSSTWHNYKIVTGDWDGNGRTDVALLSQTSGTPHLIFLSTGTDFTQVATIANADTSVTAAVADWNNDAADDLWIQKSSGDMLYTFAFAPEVVTNVSNGIGASIAPTYDRLNKNGSFYTKAAGVDGPYYAVSRLDTSNGVGGTKSTSYVYTGLILDPTNPPSVAPRFQIPLSRLLSFQKIQATDLQTGIVSENDLLTSYPFAGRSSLRRTYLGTTLLLNQNDIWATTTSTVGSNAITLTQSLATRHDLDGSALPQHKFIYTYDVYDNPLTIEEDFGSYLSFVTTNTYINDTTNWILGQVATKSVFSNTSTGVTRHYSYAHDTSSGLLTQEIAEPSTPSLTLENDYALDAFGNRINRTTTGAGLGSRVTAVGYDARGEFATSLTNALSQNASSIYEANFGQVTSNTDINGLTTSTAYDTFGRPTLVQQPDGNQTSYSYSYCLGVNGGTAPCPTYGAYVATQKPENSSGVQNGAEAATYYDALGRVIAADAQGFDGSWVRTATQYDGSGNISQTSRPYFVSGGTAKWTSYLYDALERVTRATFPDTSFSIYAYHGLTRSFTNAKSQTTTTLSNEAELPATITDASSHTTQYTYAPFGYVATITDPLGNVTSNTYDIRGRKIVASDPDRGSWTYGYDGLSELTLQVDANAQTTNFAYDLLGRPIQRAEPSLTSNWVYDTASMGIGSLASACTGPGCVSPTGSAYFRALGYDSYGRPSSATLTINGASYSYATSYNGDGHLDAITYPSGLVAKYIYNSFGYLSQIKDDTTGTIYWTANTRDAEMHLTQSTDGNGIITNQTFDPNTGFIQQTQLGTSGSPSAITSFGYAFDTVGNLTSRSDSYEGFTENFCYDALNRLTNSALGASCTATGGKTIAFDATGNITSKTGVGAYAYPTSGTGSVRPHAVISITGTVNGVTNPTFSYDANGNMTGGGWPHYHSNVFRHGSSDRERVADRLPDL